MNIEKSHLENIGAFNSSIAADRERLVRAYDRAVAPARATDYRVGVEWHNRLQRDGSRADDGVVTFDRDAFDDSIDYVS